MFERRVQRACDGHVRHDSSMAEQKRCGARRASRGGGGAGARLAGEGASSGQALAADLARIRWQIAPSRRRTGGRETLSEARSRQRRPGLRGRASEALGAGAAARRASLRLLDASPQHSVRAVGIGCWPWKSERASASYLISRGEPEETKAALLEPFLARLQPVRARKDYERPLKASQPFLRER